MSVEIEGLMTAAKSAQAAGNMADAARLANKVLARDASHLPAKLLLGVVYASSGQFGRATTLLSEVSEADPDNFEALFWLGTLARKSGDPERAIGFAERAVALRAQEGHAHANLAFCLLEAKRYAEAASSFENAAARLPKAAFAYHFAGVCREQLGDLAAAGKSYARALEIAPNAVDSIVALARLRLSQGDPKSAVEGARRAVGINPKLPAAYHLMAEALIDCDKADEAEKCLRRLLASSPHDSRGNSLLGVRLEAAGRLDEAQICFRRSIEGDPNQGFAYYAFVRNKRVTPEDQAMLDTMRRLIEGDTVPRPGVAYLHYGLGKAFEDLGVFETAMRHYDAGNAISKSLNPLAAGFDRRRYAANVDWIIGACSEAVMDGSSGIATELPVFVVGMMRSGTSLVEQILSAHPDIYGAGESKFWSRRGLEAFDAEARRLDVVKLRTLAVEYEAKLSAMAPDSQRVTDKMPGNYGLLGPIHLALPHARIVHVMRNPVDTCLSIYALGASFKLGIANERENIVFAYEQYLRLMAHWRSVLPADRLLEIRYEDLIADRERVTRQMVEFCGVDWNEVCLRPEENRRSVTTPSAWQVRQPVYATSVARWRHFEPWLGAFARLL